MRTFLIAFTLLNVAFVSSSSDAALIVNSGVTITKRVTVNPVIVSNGPDQATYFGNGVQESAIKTLVNTIWAQAGIEVDFLAPQMWTNAFAYDGTVGMNNPRPTDDLRTIVTSGDAAGIGSSNPLVIDMYFVNVVPGFSFTTLNTANGLAFVGAGGVAQFVGSNLLGFAGGRDVIASVVAHEIGHNLGLFHINEAENLMQEGGSMNLGQRFNAAQISAVLDSPFAVTVTAVPEPSSLIALSFVGAGVMLRRRRERAAACCADPMNLG